MTLAFAPEGKGLAENRRCNQAADEASCPQKENWRTRPPAVPSGDGEADWAETFPLRTLWRRHLGLENRSSGPSSRANTRGATAAAIAGGPHGREQKANAESRSEGSRYGLFTRGRHLAMKT